MITKADCFKFGGNLVVFFQLKEVESNGKSPGKITIISALMSKMGSWVYFFPMAGATDMQ